MSESLPGYDHWKQGGGTPHNEDRSNPYEPSSILTGFCKACGKIVAYDWNGCATCPECGEAYNCTESEGGDHSNSYYQGDKCLKCGKQGGVPDDPNYDPHDERT